MTEPNDTPRQPADRDSGFECVDSGIGNQLWRLDDQSAGDALRRQLQAHLTICHACRLERALADRLERAGRSGEIPAAVAPRRRTIWPAISSVAAAACLAMIFVLPPRPLTDGGVTRGAGDEIHVIRPVTGETVAQTRPRIRWTPVDRATSYRVQVVGLDDDLRWSGDAETPALTIPDQAGLSPGRRFQVIVTAVPEYLTPPPGMVTWFRTAGRWATLSYRLRAAPVWLQTVLVVTVLTTLGLLWRQRRRPV